MSELPISVVELIPDRLLMGPMPNKKSISVRDLLKQHDVNIFVNLCHSKKARWYISEDQKLISSLWKDSVRGYNTVCIPFEMNSEEPLKDELIFKFISRLANIMRCDPNLKMYIHCYDGKWCSATIALCLWKFLHEDTTFDPIQVVKSMGKHELIKKKAFTEQIKRICEKDKRSLHKFF